MKSINPATEQVIAEYAEHSPARIEQALQSAERAWGQWRSVSIRDRGALMREAAAGLRRSGKSCRG